MYNILEFDSQFGIPAVLTEADASAENKFQHGVPVEPDEAPESLRLESDTSLDAYPDFFNALRAPIASDRLKNELMEFGVDNIEWYPVCIVTPQRTVPGYNVMNILGRVACLDEASSVVTKRRNKIARIKSLAVDLSSTHDAPIFRMHEYPELILVHSRVAAVLKKYSGLLILPAAGWSDESRF